MYKHNISLYPKAVDVAVQITAHYWRKMPIWNLKVVIVHSVVQSSNEQVAGIFVGGWEIYL